MHNAGCSSMCGHGIIAVTKVALEIGLIQPVEPRTSIQIETPAGIVNSTFDSATGSIEFENVPSFALVQNHVFEVPGLGQVICDLAFGGAFYVYLDAESIGLSLKMENSLEIVAMGRQIKQAVSDQLRVKHPVHDDLSFLYGTIFVAPANHAESQFRNVCVFADGELDRSPNGIGAVGWPRFCTPKASCHRIGRFNSRASLEPRSRWKPPTKRSSVDWMRSCRESQERGILPGVTSFWWIPVTL